MKYTILICLITLSLFSCKKKQSSDPDNGSTGEFSFSTSYDSVITTHANSTAALSFYIKTLSGDISANWLTCYITGMPAGVTVNPDTLYVARLLGGVFTINTGAIAVGTYPAQLVIRSKAHGVETHNLMLNVTLPPDFAPTLAGTYDSSYDFCQPSDFYHYGAVATTVADTPFLLKISNIKNLGAGFVVRTYISNVVTMPLQTVGAYKIWGSGTYSHDARPHHENDYLMSINDTLVTGIDTQTCIIHIEK